MYLLGLVLGRQTGFVAINKLWSEQLATIFYGDTKPQGVNRVKGTKDNTPEVGVTTLMSSFNSSPPGQDGRQFADGIVRCIFVNGKFCIVIKIPLRFVPKGPNDNPASV